MTEPNRSGQQSRQDDLPPQSPPPNPTSQTSRGSKSDRKPRTGDWVLWRDHDSWRPAIVADALKDGTLRLTFLGKNGSWSIRDMVAHDVGAERGGMVTQGMWRWQHEVEEQ